MLLCNSLVTFFLFLLTPLNYGAFLHYECSGIATSVIPHHLRDGNTTRPGLSIPAAVDVLLISIKLGFKFSIMQLWWPACVVDVNVCFEAILLYMSAVCDSSHIIINCPSIINCPPCGTMEENKNTLSLSSLLVVLPLAQSLLIRPG